jgi:hypothetical protein
MKFVAGVGPPSLITAQGNGKVRQKLKLIRMSCPGTRFHGGWDSPTKEFCGKAEWLYDRSVDLRVSSVLERDWK